MSKIFLIPLMYCRIQVIPPPHHHLIIKAAKLVSVFEAEIDFPLGLLKVKAGYLRGILIVVRVKLQNSHHINILYTTDKKFRIVFYLSFVVVLYSTYSLYAVIKMVLLMKEVVMCNKNLKLKSPLKVNRLL